MYLRNGMWEIDDLCFVWLFLGVSKPGHRCARIDDLASDVYSAIEYIHAEKGSPWASKFSSKQLLRARMHTLIHKEESSQGMKHAHWRVVPLQKHTLAYKPRIIDSCEHNLERSCVT